jgi:hypothetical protein
MLNPVCDGAGGCTGDLSDVLCVGQVNITDDQCQAPVCHPTMGCVIEDLSGPCDDGVFCTIGDACIVGECVSGPASNSTCDDGNPCTQDICVGYVNATETDSLGCIHLPLNGTACNDGMACTDDICIEGECVGTPLPMIGDECGGVSGALFAPCQNGTYQCHPVTGDIFCHNVTFPLAELCNDGVDNNCNGVADEAECIGQCSYPEFLDGDPCDDGDPCTEDDMCTGDGVCEGTTVDCDDSNECTTDFCAAGSGLCVHLNNTNTCDDNNECTQLDFCVSGSCEGFNPVVCDNGNDCQIGTCNPVNGTCTYENVPDGTEPCEDGLLCTFHNRCVNGECIGTELDCDDGNQCTADMCDPENGECVHDPLHFSICDDGDACSFLSLCLYGQGDDEESYFGYFGYWDDDDDDYWYWDDDYWYQCIDDECELQCTEILPTICQDFNPCTDNLCFKDEGCVFIDNSDPCDDGNYCTINEHCADGACKQDELPYGLGDLRICDDDDETDCTIHECDPYYTYGDNGDDDEMGACVPVNAPFGFRCLDGLNCTDNDACDGYGTCVGIPDPNYCDDGNPCTVNTCTSEDCKTVPLANGTPCTTDEILEDMCLVDATCQNSVCVAQALVCNDFSNCTMDSCDSNEGCVYAPKICPDSPDNTPHNNLYEAICSEETGECITVLKRPVHGGEKGMYPWWVPAMVILIALVIIFSLGVFALISRTANQPRPPPPGYDEDGSQEQLEDISLARDRTTAGRPSSSASAGKSIPRKRKNKKKKSSHGSAGYELVNFSSAT